MKNLYIILLLTFGLGQDYSLSFEEGDYISTNSFILNGDFSISITAALLSGTSGVLYQQIDGGEIILSFEDNQLRFGVKASSCGSSGGWHNFFINIDLDGNFHNFTGVYSRYNQYLNLYLDYNLIGAMNIGSTDLASCSLYDAGFGYNTNGVLLINSINIWHDIALSEEQLQSYNSNIVEEINATNSWDFINTDEFILSDIIGGNHGTINGATWVENISGCTDPYASNFNEEANVDDGSCAGYPDNGDYSLSFDGVDDYVSLGPEFNLEDYTIEIKMKTTDTYGVIISKHVGASQYYSDYSSWRLWIDDDILVSGVDNIGESQMISSLSISDGSWKDISIQQNVNNDSQYLHINGQLIGQATAYVNYTDVPVIIGGQMNGPYLFNSMIVDEIRISSIPRYNSNSYESIFWESDVNTIAHYKFNAGTGTTLYDQSGNGNHGTINGATWSSCTTIAPCGCTNPDACNYDPEATQDDGSCESLDECGECGGNNSSCSDCEGIPNGDSVEDNCGTCDNDPENDCVQDCSGTWGGDAVVDECGICDGNGIADGACDCAGNVEDCTGQCGGSAEVDVCDVCQGDNSTCPIITDIDGNIYSTIQVGTQNWMQQNLKAAHYLNGDEVPFYDYENNASYSETYGKLYPWDAVDDERYVCPDGWHVPSDDEWKTLELYLGMSQEESNNNGWRGNNEGDKLKEAGYEHWESGGSATNESGFTALPGGHYDNGYYDMGTGAYFWSHSESGSGDSFIRHLSYDDSNIYRNNYNVSNRGMAIRCIENVEGCTDSYADNYDETANVDDGSCAGYPDNGDFSLEFDGVADYVKIENSTSLNWSQYTDDFGSLSIIVDFKIAEGTNNAGTFISKWEGGNLDNGSWLLTHESGDIRLYLIGNDNMYIPFIGDGQWHQLVCIINDSNTFNHIYLDGQLIISVPSTGFLSSNDINIYIGQLGSSGNDVLNGYIDNVSIWNTALLQADIQPNMNLIINGSEENLAGYWKFNAGNGNTLYDHSGNVNHGAINGSTWSTDVPCEACGCTNPDACNYDPEATQDDGSCESLDECGVCGGSGIADDACDCAGNVEDCNGDCGGSAEVDVCGVCNGPGIPEGDCDCAGNNVLDCASVCGGSATLDGYGVCNGLFGYQGDLNGHIYYVSNSTSTWHEAVEICDNNNGHLVTITSEDENSFVSSMNDNWIWLGGTDENEEGNWEWITGEEFNYSNWYQNGIWPNQPNGGSEENYIGLNFNGADENNSGLEKWADEPQFSTFKFVLEIDPEPVFGCTDSYAENFNEIANVDDGSCTYPDNGDYSLSFDGVDDRVDTDTNGGEISDGISFSCDFRTSQISTQIKLISQWGLNSAMVHLDVDNGYLRFIIRNDDTSMDIESFGGGIYVSDGEWHSASVTYDNLIDQVTWIIDGQEINEQVDNMTGMINSSENFTIGYSSNDSYPYYYHGKISNLKIWNAPIYDYNSNTNLLLSYKFNAGSGDTLYDHSGNGNHGSINGATWSTDVACSACGCTNPDACNYDPDAEEDDGSCATLDECGVCGGNNSSCSDCEGIPNGDNVEDNCGTCDNDPANDCVQDCAGTWGGDAVVDECGICGGSGYADNCGVCDDNPENDCPYDCAGVPGGNAVEDCAGECGGTSVIDECGICGGDGAVFGDAECCEINVDQCGVCGGDDSIPEGVCDCEGNLYNCNICPTLDPEDYGTGESCDLLLGYGYDGESCSEFTGCGYDGDAELFYDTFDTCDGSCQNCNTLDPDDYGNGGDDFGWGWTGNDCENIFGTGSPQDDSPWFYDSYEACMSRCNYGGWSPWEDDPGAYEFIATMTAVVLFDGNQLGDDGDVLAAFDDEGNVRGVGIQLNPTFGPYEGTPVWEVQLRSNAEFDVLSFQYYDISENLYYDVCESYTFVINDVVGGVLDPQILNCSSFQCWDGSIVCSEDECPSIPNYPHDWVDDPGAYEFTATIGGAIVLYDGVQMGDDGDMFAALDADGNVRGVGLMLFPPFGPYLGTPVYEVQLRSNDAGDLLHFQYYDASSDEILDISETYEFVINEVIGDVINPWALHIQTTVDLSIELIAGWNWISFNVDPEDASIGSVLAMVAETAIFINSQSSGTAINYGDYGWYGGLTSLDPTQMYLLDMSEAATLTVTGVPVDVASRPIDLISGWNWIGYLPQNAGDVATALASVAETAIFINSQSSGTAINYGDYGWYGGLTTLEPGSGYLLDMSSPGELIYPAFNGLARLGENKQAVILKDAISDWDFNYADYEFIGTIHASIESRIDFDKDVVGVFVDDKCRGIAERMYFPFDDSYFYIVQVYSNIAEGEEMTFKYFDSENGEVVEYAETMTFTSNMVVGDGFNTFSLSREVMPIPKEFSLERAYPNPFNPTTTLSFAIPVDSEVSLSIYNLQGREVSTLIDGNMDAGYHSVVWDADNHASGVYFVKMVAGEYVNTQKLMLVK